MKKQKEGLTLNRFSLMMHTNSTRYRFWNTSLRTFDVGQQDVEKKSWRGREEEEAERERREIRRKMAKQSVNCLFIKSCEQPFKIMLK
jgi:hypothetical protein